MPLKLEARNGVWYIRGAHLKKSICESTRSRDKNVAERILTKRKNEITDAFINGDLSVKTFNQAADSYLDFGGSVRYLEKLRSVFGERRLRTIRPDELYPAACKLYPGVLVRTLIRQFYAPFRAVWTHAAKQGWAAATFWPIPKEKKGTATARRAPRTGSFPVTYEHAARFVTEMSPAPAYVLTTLFYTGMRPIELFALECRNVDIAARWLFVVNSKTGHPRGVPMHEFLVPLFESLVKRGGRVFRTPRGKDYQLSDNDIGRGGGQLKTACAGASRRSGVDDVSPYTGRHTVSTQLVVAGVHPYVKDQILGHAADNMSRRYTNIPQAPLIQAINLLPVPDLWRTPEWWTNPQAHSSKIVKWGAPAVATRRERRGSST